MKIGMYTEDEIFNYMTNCEGSMLGRSMYDAIFDKIYALITENEQQEKDIVKYKSLYKENKELKEQLQQKEYIINKAKEYLINPPEDVWSGHSIEKTIGILDKGDEK